MTALLNDKFAPITSSVGLIKAKLGDTAAAFLQWQESILSKYGQSILATPLECSFGDAIMRLLPLTSPVPIRYLLVDIGGDWTAFFDNGIRGTDAESVAAVLSAKMRAITLRLTSRPNTLPSRAAKADRGTYGATILQVFEKCQDCRRSIACVNDGGKWVFDERGSPYSFEDITTYKRKNKSDRFGPDLLEKYVQALGVNISAAASQLEDAAQVHGMLLEKQGNLPQTMKYVDLDTVRWNLGYSAVLNTVP